jgi:hypothetical protein
MRTDWPVDECDPDASESSCDSGSGDPGICVAIPEAVTAPWGFCARGCYVDSTANGSCADGSCEARTDLDGYCPYSRECDHLAQDCGGGQTCVIQYHMGGAGFSTRCETANGSQGMGDMCGGWPDFGIGDCAVGLICGADVPWGQQKCRSYCDPLGGGGCIDVSGLIAEPANTLGVTP